MWTDTTRANHARAGLALPSDLTDGEWAMLEPFFPPPSHVGRPRKWSLRRIVEAILYLLRGGLPWGLMLRATLRCCKRRWPMVFFMNLLHCLMVVLEADVDGVIDIGRATGPGCGKSAAARTRLSRRKSDGIPPLFHAILEEAALRFFVCLI